VSGRHPNSSKTRKSFPEDMLHQEAAECKSTMTSPSTPNGTSLMLIVEYDGTRYNGFQRQVSNKERAPKRPRYDFDGRVKGVACTIQDCLEEALMLWKPESTLESLKMRFAGRTDKGVHARGQVVVVNLVVEKDEDWEIQKAINTRLPLDVSVASVQRCRPTFEPRLECTRKQYSYTLRYRRMQRTAEGTVIDICARGGPHLNRTAHDPPCLWLCPWPLDDSQLPSLCAQLTGNHDYSAFIHKDDRAKRSYLIALKSFDVVMIHETSDQIVTVQFRLEAKGFGRSMVRNLVGFVVDVSRGHVDANVVGEIWSADNADLVHSAPASGLCLEKVWF